MKIACKNFEESNEIWNKITRHPTPTTPSLLRLSKRPMTEPISQRSRPCDRQKASIQQSPVSSNPLQSAILPTTHRSCISSPSPHCTSPPASRLLAGPRTCGTRPRLRTASLPGRSRLLAPLRLTSSSSPRCEMQRRRFRVAVWVVCRSGSACSGSRRGRCGRGGPCRCRRSGCETSV